ncbi:MAG: hypothetical protein FWG14_03000 [Peptococcaceae bacterium]|nr:hypothetical protein [Peptococcaceae bacterium]
MKKAIALFVCLSVVSVVFVPFNTQAYTTHQRSKAIHVVYDDSRSMIVNEDNVYLDRWGQAKYAMEVFAAMLEEKDTMRVYYMSDFSSTNSTNASAKITISGAEPAEKRVAKIHDTVTSSSGTPYDAVAKAYADLKDSDADEKWLVVLTDGEFNILNGSPNTNIDVNGFFAKYVGESDVKIMFLAMGDDAEEIKADPSKNIYFEHAKNSNEILGKITSICNRIFNRNKLDFTHEGKREFSFDIPMMELLVFAQGTDVKINGIKGDGAHTLSEAVNVRFSETAATNYAKDAKVIISHNLAGIVATFRDIPKGAYSLDIVGAQTVEVYYKPVVNVEIKLFQDGEEVFTQDIAEGDYQIQYGIVNEDGDFFESSLLGKVDYEAVAQNNGQSVPIKSGDTLSVKTGELAVTVSSHFLDINTAENTVTRNVISLMMPLDVEIAVPSDDFTATGLDTTGAFVVTVKDEGRLLTEEQWKNMPMPVITTDGKIDIADVRRGTDISTFEFFLKQKDGDKYATSTGDIAVTASVEFDYDGHPYAGTGSAVVNITDDIGFMERLLNWIKKIWPLLALLLGVLLYWLLWGRKKRFPKYMSNKPTILVETDSNTITKYGSFKIIPKTKWLPLCPETGTIIAAADGKPLPSLKVRAVGNERMELSNTADFAADRLGSVDFFINDQSLPEGSTRKKEMSCKARIKSVYYSGGVSTTHTCSFSAKRKKRRR